MSRRFVITAALLFAFASVPALANAPQGDWSVGPINAKSSSGSFYCSMKNGFKDGSTLVFARDAVGSNSLALDLIDGNFTAGGQYMVTLDVGMLTRQVSAVAASNRVLVMQLGDDRPFYDMLRRKNVMQVGFENRSLGFELKGTAKALDTLTECATALKEGKKFSQANIAPVNQPSDESPAEKEGMSIGQQSAEKNARDEIERLRAENRKLMLQNQRMEREAIERQEDERREQEVPVAKAPVPEVEVIPTPVEKPKKAPPQKEAKKEEPVKKERKIEASAEMPVMSYPLEKTPDVKPPAPNGADKNQGAYAPAPEMPDTIALSASAVPVVPVQDRPPEKAPEKTIDVPKKKTDDYLPQLLEKARLSAHLSAVVNDFRTYTWLTDKVAGMAEERLFPQGQTISRAAADYIAMAKLKCTADFAHKLSGVVRNESVETITGEMACIDDDTNAAAALIFIVKGDLFLVAVFESGTEGMEAALAKRDALLAVAQKN
jgi:hypothetical protein